MARGPEGKIQDKLAEFMRDHGILFKKNEVGRYLISSGWPDFTIYPGKQRAFFMEIKAPGEPLSELQAHKKKELLAAGYTYYTVDSKERGKIILRTECKLK